MKILMFSDIHFKYFSSIPVLNKKANDIYTLELERAVKSIDFVIDKAKEIRPDLVVFLGDYFHNLNTNQNIVVSVAVNSFKKLYNELRGISDIFVLNGNHDLITNKYSMIDLLPADRIFKKVDKVENMMFIPFFEPEEDMYLEIIKAQNDSKADYLFIHSEIKGFYYNKRKQIEHGADVKSDKFIFSGHIHLPQQANNIYYVGSIYPNNFTEVSSEYFNGILVFDTESKKVERIRNDYVQPFYDLKLSQWSYDYSQIPTNSVVRIVVDIDIDIKEVDSIKAELQEQGYLPFVYKVYKPSESKKQIIIQRFEEPKEILNKVIEHKYPELKEELKKYLT